MKPAVSVITPYLNSGAFLPEAIASVEEQSFEGWELILVDDGSTDDGRVTSDAAAARDPRIRSLTRPSRIAAGAAAARNWGISQSAGEFLVFLDADDRLLRNKLKTEVELMRRYSEIGMTCGGTIWWYPGEERRNWSDEARSLRPGVYDGSVLLTRAMLLQRMHVPCLCAVMVRRSNLPESQPFDERFALYEDQTMLVKVALNSPVYIGRHLTALYRQHPDSTSSRAERDGEYARLGSHRARAEFLDWSGRYVRQVGKHELDIVDALKIARARQSGRLSELSARQRARIIGWKLADAVTRIPRRFKWWLVRRGSRVALADR